MTIIDQAKYVAITVFAVLAGLFFNLYLGALDELKSFRADVESQMELVRIENEQKLAAMADVAGKATEDWNAARRELDRLGRVIRVSPHRCQGILPTPTAPSPGTDANAETRTIDPAQCEAYLNQGIEDAAQLMHLQQFLIDQHEASK